MASKRTSAERDFAAAMKVAARFPGIETDTTHGTPAIRVNGKFMARLRTEAEGWLAIKCDFADREILLQAAPHVFHLTPHYQNYPMILIDLAAIDETALLEVLERAEHGVEEGRSRFRRATQLRVGCAPAREETPRQETGREEALRSVHSLGAGGNRARDVATAGTRPSAGGALRLALERAQ